MSSGYEFVPVCQSSGGHCHQSNVGLCDLKPPQFPAWFNQDKKTFLMQNCPSWKHYQKFCKAGTDYPPWWVALIVIGVVSLFAIITFVLYKKKKLKCSSRVSDVSFQAKQMCCKSLSHTTPKQADQQKGSISSQESTNKTFQNDEGLVIENENKTPPDVETLEPYYYVLENSSSVTVKKNSPGMGTFGRRNIPPPPYQSRLPPLDTVNNNGLGMGKVAFFSPASGRVQIVQSPAEGKKPKKSKRKRDGPHVSAVTNLDDRYIYGDH